MTAIETREPCGANEAGVFFDVLYVLSIYTVSVAFH
jgi:hypothetical protein